MSRISTHVLDTSLGRPASGMRVTLWSIDGDGGELRIGQGTTDNDGRISDLLPADHALTAGVFTLRFEVAEYFEARGVESFFPYTSVHFRVIESTAHHHVPLLLSPHGYSTYRGG